MEDVSKVSRCTVHSNNYHEISTLSIVPKSKLPSLQVVLRHIFQFYLKQMHKKINITLHKIQNILNNKTYI